MNLQQLRYIDEVARRGLNVSEAAAALFTSQPGVSKQIRLLEEELGVVIFERTGKRLTGITEPGRRMLETAGRILGELRNLKRIGEDYADGESGTLDIATTHTQARYALPPVVKRFMQAFPRVRLRLHQGNPEQVAEWTVRGEADLGIATEALDRRPQLLTLPCRPWSHLVIAPADHPILAEGTITLARLAREPLITYDPSFTGRTRIDAAFERAEIAPNVVLTAIDADVIKTYVSLGLGLGIIAEMAFDPTRDAGLAALPAGHLFGPNMTRLAIRRDAWLRRFDYAFIECFAPQLTRRMVETAIAGGGMDPGL
ncbi:MAG: CysB family HTH-type transcriptional regulator [Candidatus Nitricoxidivorans perseverans]|uniref:CysB family HTH-type transcriptional regulator n=1 Tax=Candidatus Nitricoxidivorans perseverans TaxID=2975601 RepID=A0AA49FM17_9PROT|nr:MAG: CysB family HTH-type transcriptional regulator [Candidatus Nitricoxidivorans perseverans]